MENFGVVVNQRQKVYRTQKNKKCLLIKIKYKEKSNKTKFSEFVLSVSIQFRLSFVENCPLNYCTVYSLNLLRILILQRSISRWLWRLLIHFGSKWVPKTDILPAPVALVSFCHNRLKSTCICTTECVPHHKWTYWLGILPDVFHWFLTFCLTDRANYKKKHLFFWGWN